MRTRIWVVILLVVGLSTAPALAQQEMRSATKGASTPLPITGTVIDADHNGLDVNIVGGAGAGGGTEFNEDTAHSTGAAGTLILGVRNDSGATTLTDANGDYSPLAVDSLGRLFIVQTSIAPGTAAGHLGKAEDAAHTTGDTGVMSLCVRRDSAATSATTDGDYNPCQTDANGQLWVKEAGIGTSTDAAATAGSTGSLSAKQRLMTSQLDSIKTAVEALDSSIPAAGALADGTSNPTTTGVAAYNMCFNGTTWDRCAGTSTLHYATSAASTNATNIKASAGTVSVISVVNTTATLYYLRMYNLASAPTCSSATGFVNTIPVPASTSGAGIVIPIAVPHAYTTGIGYCLTGGGSSTDNTNAATGVYINIWYK